MKNTLKLTTALVGSMLTLGVSSAVAQTTVSGNLGLSYFATSNSSTANTAQTFRGFGKESQINISNKGKLSNGMDYVAGFSLEMDGADVSNTTAVTGADIQGQQSENVYIDLISGNTTITFGADHIQNPDFEITKLSGGIADVDDLMAAAASADGKNSLAQIHGTQNANSAYSAHGFGLIQDFGVAKASFFYAPNRASGLAASNDSTGVTTNIDNGNSQMEIMVRGDFGVKGLDVFAYAGKSESDTPGVAATSHDLEGRKYGLSYNFGQFSVAASQSKVESNSSIEAKTTSFGAAFAATKEITIGLIHSKTEADGVNLTTVSATPDETIKALNIGYNLGPVVINAMYAQGENVGGVANVDTDALHLNFTTKF
jgi:hypothetical protein